MEESQDNKIYSIDELDLKHNTFILLASKRAWGKTVLIKNIVKNLFEKFTFQAIIIFSETSTFNGDYDYIQPNCHFRFNKIDKIDKILNYQKKKIKKNKNIDSILIIFDDIPLSKKWTFLNDLWTQGRHYKLTIILSTQYINSYLSWSTIRNNIDYCFFSDIGIPQQESIYNIIAWDKNKKEFISYVMNNNNDYQFIFYNSREPNRKNRLKLCKGIIFDLQFK